MIKLQCKWESPIASCAWRVLETGTRLERLSDAVAAPIRRHHIYEALSYRNLDRASWGATLP